MSSSPLMRVVSDGTPHGTTVTIDGKPIEAHVTRLVWGVEVDRLATATITVEDVEVDLTVPRDQVRTVREARTARGRREREQQLATETAARLNGDGRAVLRVALQEAISAGHDMIEPADIAKALDRLQS